MSDSEQEVNAGVVDEMNENSNSATTEEENSEDGSQVSNVDDQVSYFFPVIK